MNTKVATALTLVGAFALNLACPTIPTWVWSALIGAILGGNITLAHLTEFLATHGIESVPDYNIQKNGETTPPVVSIQSWKNKGR